MAAKRSTTATVETLTAAVRVLAVGSRQVTLSVYGQLDWAAVDDIEPFGRVRPRDARFGYLHLIGRHRQTGELVRAQAPGSESGIQDALGWNEYAMKIRHAENDARRLRESANQEEEREGRSHDYNYHICKRDEITDFRADAEAKLVMAAELLREYEEDAAPLREQAEELARLPLIVLAGLR